jgi:hypothetical protein
MLIFRHSPISRHLAVLQKHLFATGKKYSPRILEELRVVGPVGMDLASLLLSMTQRKEVRYMKIATSFLAALLFTGTLGAFNNATAQDGVLLDQDFTDGSYCHLKFPAIHQDSLSGPALDASDEVPVLSQSDIIDFYGPCDEDPRGKDQVWDQKLVELHQYFKE